MVLRGCVWLCSVGDIQVKTECVPRFLGFSPGFFGVGKWGLKIVCGFCITRLRPDVAISQSLKSKKGNFPS